jgi:hypothetical protein
VEGTVADGQPTLPAARFSGLVPGVTPLQEACLTEAGDFRYGFRHAGSGLRRPQHNRA